MVKIELIDSGQDKYLLKADSYILGRRYDNKSEKILVIKPKIENDSICVMIVTVNNKVIDHLLIKDNEIDITNNLSQYESVKIGFSFSKKDGYIKNSEIKNFIFLPSQKPDDFIPVEPDQKQSIDLLSQFGFVSSELNNNILVFKNSYGDIVSKIQLSGFIQEQTDWNETDPNNEIYIKNKPTKLSQFTNDMNFVDKNYIDSTFGNVNNLLKEI